MAIQTKRLKDNFLHSLAANKDHLTDLRKIGENYILYAPHGATFDGLPFGSVSTNVISLSEFLQKMFNENF